MANIIPGLDVAATVFSALGANRAGNDQDRAANFQAQQLDQQAGQTRASAQRAAIDERRQATLAQSRLQAVTGGAGGDPTIVNLSANLAGEGEYRALSALYESEERAVGMEQQAMAARYQGKQAKRAGTINAITSLVGGGSKLYEKYGAGGADQYDFNKSGYGGRY